MNAVHDGRHAYPAFIGSIGRSCPLELMQGEGRIINFHHISTTAKVTTRKMAEGFEERLIEHSGIHLIQCHLFY